MPDTAPRTRPDGPLALANGLAETLAQEHEALVGLAEMCGRHREALRARRRDLLDAATDETNEAVSRLAELRHARRRQLRLLGRVLRLEGEEVSIQQVADRLSGQDDGADVARRLLELRDTLRAQAVDTRQQCDELEFSLQYALDLGRDLIQAVQGLDATDPGSRYYSPKGSPAPSGPARSYLNRLG